MIDESILEELIPVPAQEEKMQEIREQLEEDDFPINNYNKGGILYGFLQIVIMIYIELLEMARRFLNGCFLCHAEEGWLDLKSGDYGKHRKQATKAQGYVTLHRSSYENAMVITKGHGFKTAPDISGVERKFYVMEKTVIPAGQETGRVLVEAEDYGTSYNLPAGEITVSMIYMPDVDRVENPEGWIYKAAAEQETDSSLRARALGSFAELSERTTAAKLKSVAEAVEGVLHVTIDAAHPRGQGTVDIIVTGSSGEATEGLLQEVEAATSYLKGNYEDWSYKSAVIIRPDIEIVLYLPAKSSTEGKRQAAEESLQRFFHMDREHSNQLYLDDLRFILKKDIPECRKVKIISPAADMEEASGCVILSGAVNIRVENLEV